MVEVDATGQSNSSWLSVPLGFNSGGRVCGCLQLWQESLRLSESIRAEAGLLR